MRVDPTIEIAGFRVPHIRNAFRRLGVREWCPQELAFVLGVKRDKAARLLEELAGRGIVVQGAQRRNWRVSDVGKMLMDASVHSFRRASAEKELRRLVERVTQVQESIQFMDRVVRVWLFGSMLGDSPIVGDIDIAIQLTHRDPDSSHAELVRRTNQLCHQHPSYTYEQGLARVADETLRFLRGRSHMISVHYPGELVTIAARTDSPVRLLYEDESVYTNPLETTTDLLKQVCRLYLNCPERISDDEVLLGVYRLIQREGKVPGGFDDYMEWVRWLESNGVLSAMRRHPMDELFADLMEDANE